MTETPELHMPELDVQDVDVVAEALALIDQGLGDMLHRELVSTDEVADLLLDVRSPRGAPAAQSRGRGPRRQPPPRRRPSRAPRARAAPGPRPPAHPPPPAPNGRPPVVPRRPH